MSYSSVDRFNLSSSDLSYSDKDGAGVGDGDIDIEMSSFSEDLPEDGDDVINLSPLQPRSHQRGVVLSSAYKLCLVAIVFFSVIIPFMGLDLFGVVEVTPCASRGDGRLSPCVRPTSYALDLRLDRTDLAIAGTVKIRLDISDSAVRKTISIHCFELSITSVSLDVNGELRKPEAILNDANAQQVMFDFGSLPIGKQISVLSIDFVGLISEKTEGLYRSTFATLSNDGESMLVTQFEPTYARRLFPCFDEPSFKAVFSLALTLKKGSSKYPLVAMSNMPAVSGSGQRHNGEEINWERVDDNWNRVYFEPSPVMSTYLLTIVVSPAMTRLSSRVKLLNGDIDLACWTTRDTGTVQHALQVTTHALQWYENRFQIPFPLPKLDLVGIPNFSAGAMEGWGLITFREVPYYSVSSISSTKSLLFSTMTVVHELAHQWFGNFVTIPWWSSLYQNEGFANFFEYYGTEAVLKLMANNDLIGLNNDVDIWGIYVADELHTALSYDASMYTRPLSGPGSSISGLDDPREFFDAIAYSKGGSIIRQAIAVVGETAFFNGVTSYFKKYSGSNPADQLLWDEIKSFSNDNTMDVNKWIILPGYPVVLCGTASNDAPRYVSIHEYLYSNSSLSSSAAWDVVTTALFYPRGGGKPRLATLKIDRDGGLKSDFFNDCLWYKINIGQTGYFRVHYPLVILEGMISHGIHQSENSLSPIDVANVVDDVLFLSLRVGDVSQLSKGIQLISSLLDTAASRKFYVSYVVWKSVLNNVDKLLENFVWASYYPSSSQSIQQSLTCVSNLRENLLWKIVDVIGRRLEALKGRQSPTTALLSSSLFGSGFLWGSLYARNYLFSSIDSPDFRIGRFQSQSSTSDEVWTNFWNTYKQRSLDPEIRQDHLFGLVSPIFDVGTSSSTLKILQDARMQKILELLLSPDLESQYLEQLFRRAMHLALAGWATPSYCWNFLVHYWDQIAKRVDSNDMLGFVSIALMGMDADDVQVSKFLRQQNPSLLDDVRIKIAFEELKFKKAFANGPFVGQCTDLLKT